LIGCSAGIDERGQHDVLERRFRDVEPIANRGVEVQHRTKRREHGGHQCHRVVVGRIEGDPRERPVIPLAPERKQTRFPVASWRREEHDGSVRRRHESIEASASKAPTSRDMTVPGQAVDFQKQWSRSSGFAGGAVLPDTLLKPPAIS
jgi:hypothetical protein